MIKLTLRPKYRLKLSLGSDDVKELIIGSPLSELSLTLTNILVGPRGPAGADSENTENQLTTTDW